MSLPIQKLDVDGALREVDAAVAGDTRAAFFRKAAIGGGAVMTSGTIMGMLPELAAARPSKRQDLRILNFALTLEYLEAEFYSMSIKSNALSGETLEFAKLVFAHEKIHVQTLQKTIRSLGGKPVRKPGFDFGSATSDQAKFQQLSFVLENTGVHAYLGQAGRLKSKALLAAAASILTVESRHASAIATIINNNPYQDENKTSGVTPDGAFDTPRSKAAILKAAGPFIES